MIRFWIDTDDVKVWLDSDEDGILDAADDVQIATSLRSAQAPVRPQLVTMPEAAVQTNEQARLPQRPPGINPGASCERAFEAGLVGSESAAAPPPTHIPRGCVENGKLPAEGQVFRREGRGVTATTEFSGWTGKQERVILRSAVGGRMYALTGISSSSV